MSPELAPIILIGLFGYLGCCVLAYLFPSFGMAALISIPVVKVLLRRYAGGLLVGYTYDIAAGFLAVISAIGHMGRQGHTRPVSVPGYLPLCWFSMAALLWFGNLFAKEADWAFKKSLIFSVFNSLALFAIWPYLLTPKDGRRVIRVLTICGVVAACAMPIFGRGIAEYKGARISLGGATPLGVADMCAGAIIMMIAGLVERPTSQRIMLSGLFIPVCLLAVFMTGTRGPIFGIPLLLPVLFWLYRRRISFQAAIATMLALGVVLGGTAVLFNPELMSRFDSATVEKDLMGRVELVGRTFIGWMQSPIIGNGTGSSSFMIKGVVGAQFYPHNHLLEVAYEIGLLGLICWIVIMYTGFKAGWNLDRPEWEGTEAKAVGVPLFMGFLYQFIMTFKMGTFTASYMLYFYLFATIVLYLMRQRDFYLWQQQMAQWHYMQQQQAQLQMPDVAAQPQTLQSNT